MSCRQAIPISCIRVVISSNKTTLEMVNDVCYVVDRILACMFNGGEIIMNMGELYGNTVIINASEWYVL